MDSSRSVKFESLNLKDCMRFCLGVRISKLSAFFSSAEKLAVPGRTTNKDVDCPLMFSSSDTDPSMSDSSLSDSSSFMPL